MNNRIQITLLTLILSSLLSGCSQLGSTYNESGEQADTHQAEDKTSKSILWGKDTKKSLYLDPINYADRDPLGKQQQQRIKRLVGKMISIPAGTFQMGSNSYSDEKPIHRVNISAFKLGKYEVTQKQWQAVMGNNPSSFKNCDSCPVEEVSWNDIQNFIKKLNKQTGQKFRLPSEAEWEYACRSGGKNEKYCGGSNVSSLGWYRNNSGSKTHPVGQKSPNGLGLYDMSGNVWEWVQDCWNNSYNGAPSDGSARSSSNCERRVLRGGSWYYKPDTLRSANRDRGSASYRIYTNGFRLAQD